MTITREKFKIMDNVFDNFTERVLFKLQSQGHFDELKSPVMIGKESNVFLATRGKGLVIVKIYRLENCNFNKMFDYIKYDARYLNLSKKKRKIIFSWVQREYRNLQKAREAGVNVPVPIAFKDHVIVLSMIGKDECAPMLKDVLGTMEDEKIVEVLGQVIEQTVKLHKAGIVHGDLSGFNILYTNVPVLIDFSQGTITKSINAGELLSRDISNIRLLFKKHGLDKDVAELVNQSL